MNVSETELILALFPEFTLRNIQLVSFVIFVCNKEFIGRNGGASAL
jgi:hypothetical protein